MSPASAAGLTLSAINRHIFMRPVLVWLGRVFALEMMVLLHFARGLLGL